jgi:hypothetical protein
MFRTLIFRIISFDYDSRAAAYFFFFVLTFPIYLFCDVMYIQQIFRTLSTASNIISHKFIITELLLLLLLLLWLFVSKEVAFV